MRIFLFFALARNLLLAAQRNHVLVQVGETLALTLFEPLPRLLMIGLLLKHRTLGRSKTTRLATTKTPSFQSLVHSLGLDVAGEKGVLLQNQKLFLDHVIKRR